MNVFAKKGQQHSNKVFWKKKLGINDGENAKNC
jgi:hypothetical protein